MRHGARVEGSLDSEADREITKVEKERPYIKGVELETERKYRVKRDTILGHETIPKGTQFEVIRRGPMVWRGNEGPTVTIKFTEENKGKREELTFTPSVGFLMDIELIKP